MISNEKRKILLVEDDVITAMAEKLSLEKYGYDVITAFNGREAIDLVNGESNIDLILMDIDLGRDINGPDTARSILKTHQIPIVFLSSHTEPEVVETTEKITSYGYVVKNSGITVLDASIKMAFRLFDANRQLRESELKQQAMIANIRDIIGITDSFGVVKYASPNISKNFGWEPDEIIGSESMSRIHPEDIEKAAGGYRELVSENNLTKTMIFRYRCKEGNYRTIEVTATNLINNPLINGILLNFHDITERLEIEIALRESEANYRQLYENAPAGIYRVDFRTGKFSRANDVVLGYLGYTIEELVSIRPFDLLTERSRKLFIERFSKMQQNENITNTVEYEILDKNGKKIDVLLQNKLIYDDEGRLIASDVVVYDISERKKMEEALKKSEIRLRSILGQLPGMVYRCSNDHEWTMEFISEGAFSLTGYYPSELINNASRSYGSIIHSGDREYIWREIQVAIEKNESWELEYRIFTKDNKEKWVLERGHLLSSSSEDAGMLEGYITDITSYKLAREELAGREEKYRGIFENMQDCYYEISADNGEILEISPAIESISGGRYHREELIGKQMPDYYYNAVDRSDFLSRMHEHGSVLDYEIYLKNKDGSSLPCAVSSKLTYDENGRPDKIIGIMRDISERKRTEESIQRLLQDKELILKEVHHRIKNNMNTIYGLLMLQSETIDDHASINALKDAGSRVQSMMLLYDKLYRSHDFNTISVNSYLSSLADEIVGNFPNSGTVRLQKNIEDFELDVKRIQPLGVIFNELLTNIMKYAFNGMTDGVINIAVFLNNDTVSVTVRDNGCGISESVDLNNPKGFGHMLVHLLAKQLQGTLTIEREKGTTVILEFPW